MGGSTLLGAKEARDARKDADRAARRQAEGVRQGQQENIAATGRAREALNPSFQAAGEEERMLSDRLNAFQRIQSNPDTFREDLVQPIQDFQTRINQLQSQRTQATPRQDLQAGIQGQMDFTRSGFQGAESVISPLAQMAQPYLQEQQALLGLGGQQAQQDALGRVSDPLVAEQERALMRNNAALGGVGGNVLSQLAEQTRSRTEANIGQRLGQLSNANAPALNALQNISNLRLNQGLSFADIMGGGGRDLAAQETARRQALANVELGQGSELAQLAQNLGTARAGGAAFRAQSPSPLTAGVNAGLSAFAGMGGMGAFSPRAQAPVAANVTNPNRFGNIA